MLEFSYLSAKELAEETHHQRPGTLAILGFDHRPATHLSTSLPMLMRTDLPAIGAQVAERICDTDSSQAAAFEQLDSNTFASSTSNWLVISSSIKDLANTSIERVVSDQYGTVFRHLHARGFGHLIRAWHVIPSITHGDADREIYRRFSVGRANAFRTANIHASDFPAASAVGSKARDLRMVFLASKTRPDHHENAGQSPAYEYPRQYGPVGPSFARASSMGGDVFISGTASITGHKSRGINDLALQIRTTLDNLNHLIQSVSESIERSVRAKHLKVYLKKPDFKEAVIAQLSNHQRFAHLDVEREVLFAQADICRKELLVEIEGFAR